MYTTPGLYTTPGFVYRGFYAVAHFIIINKCFESQMLKGLSKCNLGVFNVLGLIHAGDELKEVNGIIVDNKKPEEVIQLLVWLIFLCMSKGFSMFQLHSLGENKNPCLSWRKLQ